LKTITMADVAKLAKVSKSTVSQYINNRYEYMSAETKTRIEEAIADLGYQPNFIAKSLKQKKTSTIGVIVANILHAFSTQVIRAVEDVSNASNVSVIICNADDNPEKEQKYIEMLRAKQVDGLVLFPIGSNFELYQQMKKENFPLVFVDRRVEGIETASILLENENASEIAVDHLFKRGYTRIGILTTSLADRITPRVERIEGYKKAVVKRGLPLRDDYIASVDLSEMQEVLANMFSLPERPQAILAGSDLAFLEVLQFVKRKGLHIPSDLAVISMDEVSFSEIYQPRLTTILQPAYQMGKHATEILLQEINKGEAVSSDLIRYPASLIIREST
jgi:LacI family transcriptional regulator, kdg operon repressor